MSDLTELPEWVWPLLDALSDYEDEHPILYRTTDPDEYEGAVCFGGFLTDRKAWPPSEVQDAAKFRRHVLREAEANRVPVMDPETGQMRPA